MPTTTLILSPQHNCKCELYTILSPVRSINGPYQFLKETRAADYPDIWFPEPHAAAVDRTERGQQLFRYLTNSNFIGLRVPT